MSTAAPGPIDPLDPRGEISAMVEVAAPAVTDEQAIGHAAQGAKRTRRLFLAVVTGLAIKPLTLVISIVTVPLFLRYLGGAEGYGLYELVLSIAIYVGMTNLGMTMGLINKLTDYYVSGDQELARRELSTMLVALGTMTLLTAVISTVGAPLIDWRELFGVKGDFSNSQIAWAIWVACMVTAFSLLATVPNAIYFAHQELHRSNMWDGAARVLTLVACIAVVFTPLGIIGVLLAFSATAVFVRLVNGAYIFFWEKPWLRPSIRLFDTALLWKTMQQGLLLFAIQTANLFLVYIDKLIIGIGQDSTAVAGYSILVRIYTAGYGLFLTLLGPLWTASGEAVRRGDIPWVRRWLRRALLLGCGGPLLVGIVLLFWSGPILDVYLRGQQVQVSRIMIAGIAMTFCFRAWVDCRSVTLNSIGVLAPQLAFYVGHTILYCIVASIVVRPYGATGVAWAMPLTAIFTSAWGYPWLMHRYIFSREINTPTQMPSTPATSPSIRR